MFRTLLAAFSAFSLFCQAAVGPGENLLANGAFATDRTDTPPVGWALEQDTQYLGYHPDGGPGNRPYVSIANFGESPTNGETVVRQEGLSLVAGERYHVSAWVRTRDFASPNNGIIIGNAGWTQSIGHTNFNGTQDWTFVEGDFTLMDSMENRYFAAVFATRFTGELDVADFKLTALSEAAQQKSRPAAIDQLLKQIFFVPWEPRLHRIPADNPKITFKLFGKPAADFADLELTLSTSDTDSMVIQPLKRGLNTVELPAGAKAGTLTATIRKRTTQEKLFATTQEFSVIPMPPVSTEGHRRLNNLVTELLNATVQPESPTLTFDTERDGWVFIAAYHDNPGQFSIILDKSGQVMTDSTPRHETFRELPRGTHTLTLQGDDLAGMRVVVRQIAEVFNYCPMNNSPVRENPPYDWAFHTKYGLPAITTQNGGNIPAEERKAFRAQGYRWLGNLNCARPASPETMPRLLDDSPGMNEPQYDGVTCDEQFFNSPASLYNYATGLRNYPNPKNRLIYTWIVGKPIVPGIDHDFLAACVDASHGRGKLLIEAYCRTKSTEEEARNYLEDYIIDTARKFREHLPGILESTGVILGDFNQLPIISLHHHPEVDYKYYLDMQLNLIANAPELDGLGCTGYWGSYYADHELHRWAYMLLRHYCVEGNTSMLSEKYGFTYLPGHVENGDFRDSFQGWTVQGNITLDQCPGLANSSQNRWGGNQGVGDTFAVFHKTADEVSTLAQTAKGLVPGKTYLLQFVTFDADDAHARKVAGRDIGIRAKIGEGAHLHDELSWQHIDRRENGRYAHNNGCVRPNLHHIVFTASAPEVTITLDNALAQPGENLGVNFFAVTPFLLEE